MSPSPRVLPSPVSSPAVPGPPSPVSSPAVPGLPASAPPPCGVPAFDPLRVDASIAVRLRRALWRQRRTMAAGLALTAAALAAMGPGGGGGTAGFTARGGGTGTADAAPERVHRPAQLVSAPVRIADVGTARLLRPGSRVDVVAAGEDGTGSRVLAKGALVADVPQAPAEGRSEEGALIVLSVPRSTAASLAGAGISARLAVVLC